MFSVVKFNNNKFIAYLNGRVFLCYSFACLKSISSGFDDYFFFLAFFFILRRFGLVS
jgi:hypothetical protein